MASGAAALLAGALLHLKLSHRGGNAAIGSNGTPACRVPRWAAGAANGLAAWLLLLVLVHVASPDPPSPPAFPESCEPGKALGCSRVAVAAPHRSGGAQPLSLHEPLSEVAAALRRWLAATPRTTLLAWREEPDGSAVTVHARCVSALWGFADDLFVRLSRVQQTGGGSSSVLVETQGQLRLGVGDMNVNAARNAALLSALSHTS